jgi:hypothetical protein
MCVFSKITWHEAQWWIYKNCQIHHSLQAEEVVVKYLGGCGCQIREPMTSLLNMVPNTQHNSVVINHFNIVDSAGGGMDID